LYGGFFFLPWNIPADSTQLPFLHLFTRQVFSLDDYFYTKYAEMTKYVFFLSICMLLCGCSNESLMRTMDTIGRTLEEEEGGLTSGEVAAGLKEALKIGINNAVQTSSRTDGFYKNPSLFIPFPEDAEKVKNTAINLGMRSQVERFEKTLNRAAEEAVKEATPVFINAITSMTIEDAFGLLRSESHNAATAYLRSRTESELLLLFKPSVEDAIEKVELTKYWNPLSSAYNTATTFTGGEQVNPDLPAYVTDQAMDGLFLLVEEEEKKIRENPGARVSDLLKKVFGSVDAE
jgi:hypothetical protein